VVDKLNMDGLNHAIFKGLLFLGAGSVVMATGTRHIEQFGGLLRQVDAVADVSRYFVHEVRYRAEIEPTVRALSLRTAGARHCPPSERDESAAGRQNPRVLAYVLVLAVILLMWLGGTT
jgi:hypothetical protein